MESIRELAPILGRLNAKYGVFAVQGNYDCVLGPDLIRSQLAARSIEVLVNRGLHVGPSAGRLFLAGLDSGWKGEPDPNRAFAGCRQTDVALALVHEPDYFPTLVRLTPVDVQLSGHSHGGQVRLPALGPLILPPWGQIYHTGLYDLNGHFVYTGRGLRMTGLPVRLRAGDSGGLEAAADAGGDGKAARFVITLPPRELPYERRPPGNLLLSGVPVFRQRAGSSSFSVSCF